MMGLNPGPLVRVIFYCVLKILLVVLVAWGLAFLYKQELGPNVTFLHFSCWYQYDSSPKVVDSSKCFGAQIINFPSKFKNLFYSYIHGMTLPHSFQLLLLLQKHDPSQYIWIHPLAFKY